MLCQILFDVRQTDGLLFHAQIEIWQKQSPLFCCSVKDHIFVDLQIKDIFHSKSQLLYLVCPITGEKKGESNFYF